MSWNLWIDDQRDPEDFLRVRKVKFDGYEYDSMTFPEFEVYLSRFKLKAVDFVWCKSASEAIREIEKRGVPAFMALDHDLGDHDVFVLLKWLSKTHPESPPKWHAHSANWGGKENINAFMNSWHRSLEK